MTLGTPRQLQAHPGALRNELLRQGPTRRKLDDLLDGLCPEEWRELGRRTFGNDTMPQSLDRFGSLREVFTEPGPARVQDRPQDEGVTGDDAALERPYRPLDPVRDDQALDRAGIRLEEAAELVENVLLPLALHLRRIQEVEGKRGEGLALLRRCPLQHVEHLVFPRTRAPPQLS